MSAAAGGPWADDLALALRAVHAAAEVVMRAFRVEQEVRYKSDEQPVTDADLAADRILKGILRGARPDYGWLSEETADSADRLSRRRLWVVDPIDGTSSFVQGRAEFAVGVGLVQDGRAVVGVVMNPATGEVFHAAEGAGAWRGDTRLRVTDTGFGARPRMVASRWETKRGELDAFRPGCELLPLGSTAYKMTRVAEGGAEAFVSRGPKAEWDVCAPAVVVTEAGGRVTTLDGAPIVYNRPETHWRGLVVSNGAVHDDLLRIVAAGAGD